MNEQSTEAAIQTKGLNAPRLSPALIDAAIIADDFWNPPGTTLTVCVLTLKNGTHVVGESACVSPENFDAEIGKKIARDNARHKVWALEGYLLKEKLASGDVKAEKPNGLDSYDVGDNVISIFGAERVGVTGKVEIIRSIQSVGVRTEDGDLWHENSANWSKVA
jgi:hypothetical protein